MSQSGQNSTRVSLAEQGTRAQIKGQAQSTQGKPRQAAEFSENQALDEFARKYSQKLSQERLLSAGFGDQYMKLLYEMSIKISLLLFGLGKYIILTSGTTEIKDQFILFVTAPARVVHLVILLLSGAVILTSTSVYQQPSGFSAKLRKNMNFYIDIVRVILYLGILHFIFPFVLIEQIPHIFCGGFWGLSFAYLMFVIRSVLKWKVYMFGEQKDNLVPWECTQNNTGSGKLMDYAKFFRALQKQTQSPAFLNKADPSSKEFLEQFSKYLGKAVDKKQQFDKVLESQKQNIQHLRDVLKIAQKMKKIN